jgi:hypothetical protein
MAGGISPFDTAIMDMADGQEVDIACPYLSLSYLGRITKRSKGWRLLTDVQEWLTSHSKESRGRIVNFVLKNQKRVRHCKDLHAKVLIAGARAMAGSANFTDRGITGRVEVSVLFENCEQVEELRAWFDLLWSRTALVSEAELRSCVATLPSPLASAGITPLPCVFPGVRSQLRDLGLSAGSADAEERLIERLRLAPDRQWAECYLNLAREVVEIAQLGNDDPRLVMSLPQSKCLPITINHRYVLTAFHIDEGQHEKRWVIADYRNPPGHAVLELILPGSMKDRIDELPGVIRHSSFDPAFAGETAENVPRFVSFSAASRFHLPPEVLEGWQEAFLAESDHGRVSNVRKYHEPVVYRAVTDLQYRRGLLDRAFPITGS